MITSMFEIDFKNIVYCDCPMLSDYKTPSTLGKPSENNSKQLNKNGSPVDSRETEQMFTASIKKIPVKSCYKS